MPVSAHVLRHAADRPHHPAVRGRSGELSYAELAARIAGAARRLPDLLGRAAPPPSGSGAGRGALVAVSLDDPIEMLVAVLAADLAGATPLVCDPSWGPERRAQVTRAVPLDAFVDAPLSAPAAAPPPMSGAGAPDDPAWACFSSGSTGRPRAVVRTRASWTASFPHLDRLTGIGPGDVVLIPGPLVSSLYAFAAVHTLATGATAVLPGRWSPADLAADLAEATVVHLVPHRLPTVLDALSRTASPLRTAVIGGAALPAGARERAAAAGVHVVSYYGATELSFVAMDADGAGLRPFPGVDVEVRVPRGQRLGEVWARSPWLSQGYLAGAAGPLRADDAGWMTVGDLAEPYRPGEVLRLRGRGDGAIQTGGATVVPEDVEEVLRSVPGVGDLVVVGSPHPSLGSVVTAVLETRDTAPPPRASLEAAARSGLDTAQRPRRWYAVHELPRTPTGKPARGLVATRLADGDPGLRRLN
ncbi:AMP-binding protein [Nonomuraea sp. SMC257]|uniref:AMP-binding protein n=1 Tax=Nonomuraea montanisoli TaxID=2741721 RepID=A0A7Y6M0F7_9ACTN|nr:AMP-binding protein [Nonomuraea montanisoli]NUW29927.1 AMP-binding protein [Nonomuraea montanisoli]